MSTKTPAELQLEFLKKLKEQKKAPASRPRASASPEVRAADNRFSLSPLKKKAARRGIPLSEAAWSQFKAEGIDSGKFKLNQALGDWALELILKVPPELQELPGTAREALFRKISDWIIERGHK